MTTRQAVDDKDISDFILAERKVKTSDLVDLVRSWGVVLSSQDTRREIADRLCTFPFDQRRLSELLALSGTAEGRPTHTVRSYDVGNLSAEDLQLVLGKVRDSCQSKSEEASVHKSPGLNLTKLQVAYDRLEPGRNVLSQVRKVSTALEFKLDKGKLEVKLAVGEKGHEILGQVVHEITTKGAHPELNKDTISLFSVKDADLRSRFFVELATTLPARRMVEVTNVRVHNIHESDDDGGQTDSGEEEDSDEASDDPKGRELRSVLRNADLHGSGLLTNPTYQGLVDEGYYATRIVWTAESAKEQIEFEAAFQDTARAEDFSYRVRSIRSRGPRDGWSVKRPPAPDEERSLGEQLLSHARKVQRAILSQSKTSKTLSSGTKKGRPKPVTPTRKKTGAP